MLLIKKYSTELYHYGVLGQKWGVRRYQNKDGTLTAAGKRRLVRNVTSRKTSTIDARSMIRDTILSDKELGKWRESNSYKNTLRAKNEYLDAKEKYFDAEEKVYRSTLSEVEKKYGRYADLERSNDSEKMRRFNKEYFSTFEKRLKENGVYDLEKDKNDKYEALEEARKTFREDTKQFVNDYLDGCGDKPLKGQGSAIYRGQNIVERLTTSDIFARTFAEIDHIDFRMYSND